MRADLLKLKNAYKRKEKRAAAGVLLLFFYPVQQLFFGLPKAKRILGVSPSAIF